MAFMILKILFPVTNLTCATPWESRRITPICDGVRPFFASLNIWSLTSPLDNFSQVGTLRLYGRADWDIPFPGACIRPIFGIYRPTCPPCKKLEEERMMLSDAKADEMEDLLQSHLDEKGINCDEARNEEERMMLSDAKEWLSSGEPNDTPHPKTGATALHVAAAKGYIKVMDVLLQGGLSVNVQDFDGWTPLHAAAHWGQREAAELLCEHYCDMDMKNYVGQTALDVADVDMGRVLEELQRKQTALQRERGDINSFINKKANNSPNKRRDVVLEKPAPLVSNKETTENTVQPPDLVPKVKVEIQPQEIKHSDDTVEKKNKANKDEPPRIPTSVSDVNRTVPNIAAPNLPPKQVVIENEDSSIPSWRRPGSFRNRGGESTPNKNLTLRLGEKEVSGKVTSPTGPPPRNLADASSEVSLRRTQSFEADEKFYRRYLELRAKINAGNSCPALHSSPSASLPTRSASLKEKHHTRCLNARRGTAREDQRLVSPTSSNPPLPPGSCITMATMTTTTATTVSSPVTTNTTATTTSSVPQQTTHVRRSFVPPVRDEESETQRKAHAKRVRETRRSTQGVTLDEIKSAEQLVKKKQQQQLQQATQQLNSNEQFMLEDARIQSEPTNPPDAAQVTLRRGSNLPGIRPASAPTTAPPAGSNPPGTDTAEATVTLPLRKQSKPPDDREQDKENDVRNAQATQAVIQRRRRPKRRSTGVVHVDMDEIDPDRQDIGNNSGGGGDADDAHYNSSESGGERSRLSSASGDGEDRNSIATSSPTTENGELDYKKLYEESVVENDRLRGKLRKTEEDLQEVKSRVENSTNNASKLSLSELEKRERRAMERKLSEMEEELKQLEQLRNDNQKLKDENGALIRVISKLSK